MDANTHLATEKAQRDYQLVCQAREHNDQAAYTLLMNTYRDPLYKMLLKMTENPADADDLTLEAFGKAFNSLHLYNPTGAFSTWLFTIAANNCLDHFRKQHIQFISLGDLSSSDEEETPSEYPLPADAPTPEEEFMSGERAALVRRLISKLQPDYAEMIQMRYFEELTYDEMVERTGLPMGTVKSKLLRARARLAELAQHEKNSL